MKLFSSLRLVGDGQSFTACTFSSSVLMPSPHILCPKNFSSHEAALIWMELQARRFYPLKQRCQSRLERAPMDQDVVQIDQTVLTGNVSQHLFP